MSRATAKHTTVAKRKCTTGVMGDGGTTALIWALVWVRGPWAEGPGRPTGQPAPEQRWLTACADYGEVAPGGIRV